MSHRLQRSRPRRRRQPPDRGRGSRESGGRFLPTGAASRACPGTTVATALERSRAARITLLALLTSRTASGVDEHGRLLVARLLARRTLCRQPCASLTSACLLRRSASRRRTASNGPGACDGGANAANRVGRYSAAASCSGPERDGRTSGAGAGSRGVRGAERAVSRLWCVRCRWRLRRGLRLGVVRRVGRRACLMRRGR